MNSVLWINLYTLWKIIYKQKFVINIHFTIQTRITQQYSTDTRGQDKTRAPDQPKKPAFLAFGRGVSKSLAICSAFELTSPNSLSTAISSYLCGRGGEGGERVSLCCVREKEIDMGIQRPKHRDTTQDVLPV